MMEINVRDINEQGGLVTVPIITGEVINGDDLESHHHSSTTIINVPLVQGDDGTFLNVPNSQGLIITTAADGTVYLDPSQVALFESAVVPLEDADIGRSGLEPCSSILPIYNSQISEISSLLSLQQTQTLPPGKNDSEIVRPPVGKGPFKCDLCDKIVDKWNQLQRHMRSHADDKPHRCNICSATFNVEVNLNLHRATHNIGNPICPQCGKRFSRIAGLKAHIMLHEMDENLTCNECGDEFSTQNKLNKHLIKHKEEAENQIYSCKQCSREFNKAAELREHLKAHYRIKASLSHRTHKRNIDRSNFNHNCHNCGKLFQKPSQLERHLRIHTGEKPFTCEECGKSFNQKGALRIHEMNHNGLRPHTCEFCSATFSQRGNLRAHIQRVHTIVKAGAAEEFFCCKECSCVFKKLGALNAHISRSHPVVGIVQLDIDGGDGRKDVNDVIKQLIDLNSVSEDQRANKSGSAMENNMNEDLMDGNSDLLQQAIQNSGLTGDQQVSQKDLQRSSDEKLGNLVRRLPVRRVFGVRYHQCVYCTKTFKKPSDLVRHIRVHTHEKPFKCEQCYRSFTVKSTLTSHQRTHTGIKAFCCNVCQRMFSTHGSLKVHQRLHTGAKPFDCPHCDKKFRTSGHRKSHLASHFKEAKIATKKTKRAAKKIIENPAQILPDVALEEPLLITDDGLVRTINKYSVRVVGVSEDTGERPYTCSYCSKGFKKSSHLKQHVRSHTGEKPYRCPTCSKGFVSSGVLNAHLRTHTKEKAFGCAQCEATFTTNGSLKRHMCIHSESRPFMCPYSWCMKKFKTVLNCKKHIKCHKHELSVQAAAAQTTNNENLITLNPVSTNNQSSADAQASTEVAVEIQLNGSDMDSVVDPTRDLSLRQVSETVEQLQQHFSEENPPLNFDHFTSSAFHLSDQLHPTLDMSALGDSFVSTVAGLGVHSDLANLLSPTRQTPTEPIMDVGDSRVEEGIPTSLPSILPIPLRNDANEGGSNVKVNSKKLNKCSYCYRTFKRLSHVKQHERSHSGEKPFGCSLCNRYFVSNGVLKAHLKTHMGVREFACYICRSTFTTNGSLTRHMQIHNIPVQRRKQGVRRSLSSQCENTDESGDEEQQITNSLNNSIKKAKNTLVKFTEEQTVELANQNKEAAISVSEKILIASAAEKNRISEIKDKEEELLHKPRFPHACNQCKKSFKKPSDLTRHVRIHTGEKPFSCDKCQKKFTVKSTLDSHKKTHLKEKKFNCHVCNSNFTTKGSLKVHMRLHTGAKPFKCPHCELRFRTSGHRKSHIFSHMKTDKNKKRKHTTDERAELKGSEPSTTLLHESQSISVGLESDGNNYQNPVLMPQELLSMPVHQEGTVLSNITLSLDPVLGDHGSIIENGTQGVQLQFSSGLHLVTQTIQIDANILQQLQEQGNINITLDPTASQELMNSNHLNACHNVILQPVSVEMTLNKQPSLSSPKADEIGTEVNLNITEAGEMVTEISALSNSDLSRAISPDTTIRTIKDLQCDICDRAFSKKSQLINHVRHVHTDKIFKCPICNRTYNQKSSLQNHLLTHSAKEVKCPICNASFTKKGNLTVHMRRFHKQKSISTLSINNSTATDETVPINIFNT